jgi:benzoyl-CoA reductase/2-hydroxyglutaryl-CoA dehydratase subunit BcrC/BadD/HgdB
MNMIEKSSFLIKLDNFLINEKRELREFKGKGGEIAALFCRFFPFSLLEGLKMWPVRVLSGATGDAEDASERLIRPDTCPYCKSIIGNFLLKQNIHSQVDLIVGLITCDQMRRTLERLATDIKIPVFPVQLPATQSEQSLHYFALGMQGLLDNICAHLNRSIDYAIVRRQEKLRMEIARILRDIIYKANTPPDSIHRLFHASTWSRPGSFLSFLREYENQLPSYNSKYNVITAGSVVCEENKIMVKTLQNHQAGYIPVSCSGLNALEGFEQIDTVPDSEVVARLARITFNAPSCIRNRPNNPVYDRLLEIIQKTKARGVILRTLSFCDIWYTEKERMRQILGVPVLVLESGFGEGEKEREITRLESFLESIE